MGKQFKDAAANASPVYNKIIGIRQEVQALDAQEVQTTQGKKGMKQQRINMAFTPENLDYLRTMAGIKGISITRYVNGLIAHDREKNADAYKEARRITESL